MSAIKILSLSDEVIDFIYSPQIRNRFLDVNLILGCGDLPFYYLEYVVNMLDTWMYYVHGNHAHKIEYCQDGERKAPRGGVNLHRQVVRYGDLLLAGVEGSLRYRDGPFQYTQGEMWGHVFSLIPRLLINRVRFGRYLDVFVSHAPPLGIHDQPDLPHRGIAAFRWLLHVFKPAYHFHGHVHLYRSDAPRETIFEESKVINTYRFVETLVNTDRLIK